MWNGCLGGESAAYAPAELGIGKVKSVPKKMTAEGKKGGGRAACIAFVPKIRIIPLEMVGATSLGCVSQPVGHSITSCDTWSLAKFVLR